MSTVAYLLGFLAAASNAASNTLQRAANRAERNQQVEFSLQLIRNLLHQPLWFAGMGAMTLSFLLQATGLGFGTLAGVEPVLVLELPLTMVASRLWLKEGMDRTGWTAVSLMTASTVALIACLGPSSSHRTTVHWWVWAVAISATAVGIGVCYLLGVRWNDESKRSAVLGVGTGACYGLSASLIKGMTTQFSQGGVAAVFGSWQLYGAVAAGFFAVWMHQNAVSAARLMVAQPGVTLGDPYVSIVWGVLVFHESTRGGPWIAGEVIAALVLVVSSVALSRSRSTAEQVAADRASRVPTGQQPETPAVTST